MRPSQIKEMILLIIQELDYDLWKEFTVYQCEPSDKELGRVIKVVENYLESEVRA